VVSISCVWVDLTGVVSLWWFSLERSNSGIRAEGSCGDQLRRVHISKVFLIMD